MNGNKFNAWSLPQVNNLFFFCAWFTGNNKDIAFAFAFAFARGHARPKIAH